MWKSFFAVRCAKTTWQWKVLTSAHVIMIKLLLIQKYKILAFELLCKFEIKLSHVCLYMYVCHPF